MSYLSLFTASLFSFALLGCQVSLLKADGSERSRQQTKQGSDQADLEQQGAADDASGGGDDAEQSKGKGKGGDDYDDKGDEPTGDDDFENPGQSGDDVHQNSDPGTLTVASISYQGNGCLEDSARITIPEDSLSFGMIYDDFALGFNTYEGEEHSESKSCRVEVTLKAGPGFSFAVAASDIRGMVALDDGAEGSIRSKISVVGQVDSTINQSWQDATDEDFTISDDLPILGLKYSSCVDSTLTMVIDTEISLNAEGVSGGDVTVSSLDGLVSQNSDIHWKRCD